MFDPIEHDPWAGNRTFDPIEHSPWAGNHIFDPIEHGPDRIEHTITIPRAMFDRCSILFLGSFVSSFVSSSVSLIVPPPPPNLLSCLRGCMNSFFFVMRSPATNQLLSVTAAHEC